MTKCPGSQIARCQVLLQARVEVDPLKFKISMFKILMALKQLVSRPFRHRFKACMYLFGAPGIAVLNPHFRDPTGRGDNSTSGVRVPRYSLHQTVHGKLTNYDREKRRSPIA